MYKTLLILLEIDGRAIATIKLKILKKIIAPILLSAQAKSKIVIRNREESNLQGGNPNN